jgi:hypothetical protein
MPGRSADRVALIALLAIGFLYAGAATVRRYIEIYQSPVPRSVNASIDAHLAPARIAGADALRHAVAEAGWLPGEDVLVLARASTVTRGDLYQVFYTTGYLLYPTPVWIGAWCDARATRAQCDILEAGSAELVAARHRARRMLVIGGGNPFPSARSSRLSDIAALVSLP